MTAGGRLIGITSQSTDLAQEAKSDWGLDYEVVSDPSNGLAKQFGINITDKADTPMADHPTEVNLFGASDRPLPDDVWAAIVADRDGTEIAPDSGRRLDPEFLAENYPEQFAYFEAWVASMSA